MLFRRFLSRVQNKQSCSGRMLERITAAMDFLATPSNNKRIHNLSKETGFLSNVLLKPANSTSVCMFRELTFGSRMSSKTENSASPFKEFPVEVGAMLTMDISGAASAINVTIGNDLEKIMLQAEMMEGPESVPPWDLFKITTFDNRVFVKPSPFSTEQLSTLLALNARIPARWCSVDIRADLGSVFIESVREGTLSVKTGGGAIKLGELKGNAADIDSSGGHFEAGLVSADSDVRTGGGNIFVNKIVGTNILLDSGGGSVTASWVYGDEVRIESRGGSVTANHIRAERQAVVCSDGGNVTIHGLDGNARVVSKGGTLEIQLHEHAQQVDVDAGVGDILLGFSTRLVAQLEFHSSCNIVQEQPILRPGCEPGVFLFVGDSSLLSGNYVNLGWRGSENSQVGQEGIIPCKIKVSSANRVSVMERSWLETIKGNDKLLFKP